MSIFRFSARRAVVFALLLLASLHIDASVARALTAASHVAEAGGMTALAGGPSAVATLGVADEPAGAFTSKTCPRAGACVGYILPLAPPLAVPAPVRGRHLQVVWQEPTPVAMGRLTPPPR